MNTFFTLHLAATWMLVGLIWMVQLVVYPQFLGIQEADFPAYHFRHCFRIGLIVVPLMLLEAGTGAWLLCHSEGSAVFLLGAGLIPVIWLSTALVQAPIHTRLKSGQDSRLVRRLILTNWIRTLAWTIRGLLVSLTLMNHHLLLSLFTVGSLLQAQTTVVPAPPAIRTSADGTVTLSSSEPGTVILYTLDDTPPVAKSNPYLAPIDLGSGGHLMAASFTTDRRAVSSIAEVTLDPVAGREPLPSTRVPVTQDRSWPQYDWEKRHELTSAAVKRAKPQILFIGDSITHFFGGEQFDSYALRGTNTWDEFYAPRNAGNLGFGWDKTENVLWRLQHGAVDGISPKLIVMMIGTNNTGNMGPNHKGTCSAADIAGGIEAIVLELENRLPASKILLLGIFPRGEKPNPQREKIAQVNQIIAKLDGSHHVTFLDIGPKFLTPDGRITKDIMPDYLHPNEKGYRIWAEAIEPTVKRLMGE
ncbi:MAG: chitobiase/beta-hexosaminidase C-terminal domain-containing protein [Prosthecobacter sp.]|jgi:lysophospholipase L1-like esterase|uniref:GDSL-type esterase/lipase family protein n=1 Tax=Prosthecobacter sp. TaxID=1965333 RepID=UPI0019E9F3B9|nr:GDSL-type esterase/lipase family protein [Prosthecobacter sp.]MBE2283441.1 chitobiase/beta-hexosaminidase C-terminal domain-containing protein [Prosthecobacter sp.]